MSDGEQRTTGRTSSPTLLIASSSCAISRMHSRTGTMAALRQSSRKSEPEKPVVLTASTSRVNEGSSSVSLNIYGSRRLTSRAGRGFDENCTKDSILNRCSAFGRPTANRFGMRRKIAGSMSIGRFVAPRTIMRSSPDVNPSHDLRHPCLRRCPIPETN